MSVSREGATREEDRRPSLPNSAASARLAGCAATLGRRERGRGRGREPGPLPFLARTDLRSLTEALEGRPGVQTIAGRG